MFISMNAYFYILDINGARVNQLKIYLMPDSLFWSMVTVKCSPCPPSKVYSKNLSVYILNLNAWKIFWLLNVPVSYGKRVKNRTEISVDIVLKLVNVLTYLKYLQKWAFITNIVHTFTKFWGFSTPLSSLILWD